MRKLLLLLGASKYPDKPDLAHRAFKPSHCAFKQALTEGTPPPVDEADCLDLFDSDLAWYRQQLEIDAWVKSRLQTKPRPEALLIHYVGHGGIAAGGGAIYLTINSTNDLDPCISSIPRTSLQILFDKSLRTIRKFLIFDCCFAGAAVKDLQSPLHDKLSVELAALGKPDTAGLAALCSSDSVSSSIAAGFHGLTQFTDGLLDVLKTGDSASMNDLSLEQMRELIATTLARRYGAEAVMPSSYFQDDINEPIHKLPLFPNRAERPLDILRPRAVRPPPEARGPSDTALQLALGNPSDAGEAPHNFLVRRPQFALSYNAGLGRPNWVSWQLRFADLGNAKRSNRFLPDPLLPQAAQTFHSGDFLGTGYDRGTLCTSMYRTASPEDRNACFLLSNVIAQAKVRNRRLWASYEAFCRDLVRKCACDLYMVAGATGSNGKIGDGRIDVPAALWQVVLCIPEGVVPGPGLRAAEVFAISMANHDRSQIDDWTECLVRVAFIEDVTGYRFFSSLDPHFAAALRKRELSQRLRAIFAELKAGGEKSRPSEVA